MTRKVFWDEPYRTTLDPVVSRVDGERVQGFATMACGGTHPKSTGEIGALKLKRKNIGKGKERIEIAPAEHGASSGMQTT
jgi:alanyl-tRNA synthetase